MRTAAAALTLLIAALGTRALAQAAPADYAVAFRTTNGNFTVTVHRDWAPIGADRFYTLVKSGYYNGDAFFRVVPGFVVQWGLSPDPNLSAVWEQLPLHDDPVRQSNRAGRISFAASGRNSRTAQVFVNLHANPELDRKGFAPFGEVTAGMEVIAHMASDYGDIPPLGRGPDPRLILQRGAAYLTRMFPRLDVIYSATLTGTGPSAAAGPGLDCARPGAPRVPLLLAPACGPEAPSRCCAQLMPPGGRAEFFPWLLARGPWRRICVLCQRREPSEVAR